MKLQVFSDLHCDVAPIKPIAIGEEVDAVVVAGDTCQGVRHAFTSLRRLVSERVPIIMIAGNHEYYRRCIETEIAEAKAIAGDYNILFVNDDVALLGGTTRIIGATLWTNYRVFGDANAAAAMATARRNLNDHRVISWTKNPWKRFRPEEALLLHERSKAFIVNALTNTPPSVTSTVILTHHAPHFGSVAKGPYESDILTAAYVSDLTDVLMIDGAADGSTGAADATVKETSHAKWDRLWLHGHIHSSSDYVVGTTRILANPHGYGAENPSFNPQLIVEVGS